MVITGIRPAMGPHQKKVRAKKTADRRPETTKPQPTLALTQRAQVAVAEKKNYSNSVRNLGSIVHSYAQRSLLMTLSYPVLGSFTVSHYPARGIHLSDIPG